MVKYGYERPVDLPCGCSQTGDIKDSLHINGNLYVKCPQCNRIYKMELRVHNNRLTIKTEQVGE